MSGTVLQANYCNNNDKGNTTFNLTEYYELRFKE